MVVICCSLEELHFGVSNTLNDLHVSNVNYSYIYTSS